jgi:hypothetical protein
MSRHSIFIKVSSVVVAGLLFQFLANTVALGTNIEDLNLGSTEEHWLKVVNKIENPHDLSCDECHPNAKEGVDPSQYDLSENTIDLCRRCHGEADIHPVNIALSETADKTSMTWLPLGRGELEGKIVCLTCHYIHARTFYRNLLRGEDLSRKSRQEFLCSTCHGTQLTSRSPHDPDNESCSFCHTKTPRSGLPLAEILRPDIQNRCNFCHDTLFDGHYLTVNPFPDFESGLQRDMNIPLLQGRFTCISCHDPHSLEDQKIKMLRDDYLALAADSNRVNPHWKDVMCISCHYGEPDKEDPKLKDGGDINVLCNRCHDGKIARNDVHPIGKEPGPSMNIPSTMPLSEGKMTCETCHDSSLQEGGERRDSVGRSNPNFLREGMLTRNEFCLRCHTPENYEKLNAHDQVDESGSMKSQICLFCHSSLPDVKVMGIESVDFDVESLNEYCTVCHEGQNYLDNHPVGPHLVEPSRSVYRAIETAGERLGVELPLFDEIITCATCHNPHQEGVIKIDVASKGAGQRKRLRLAAGRWQCVGCHYER